VNATGSAAVAAVVPQHASDLARLCVLLKDGEPVVTVIGKYNHGKSMLLNELMGCTTFEVADKRQTVALSERLLDGVRWLDAPGLDADVGSDDDRHALHAAWTASDVRLFVHAAKEGELDGNELALMQQLQADSARTQRQTLFILSQVDQLPDEAAMQAVSGAIGTQLPSLAMHSVSSMRHRRGIDSHKALLVERSGLPQLHAVLAAALQRVPAARVHERKLLFADIWRSLDDLQGRQQQALQALLDLQQAQRLAFDTGLRAVIVKVGAAIGAMLDTLGFDHAAVADTAKDAYAVTAGKQERATIQIAYSRACIEIDSYLAGHGVVDLPMQQQTIARVMNTVMIAVMGVSVKFRKDLRRMFCTEDGRARLVRDFKHYYELSAERMMLVGRIEQARHQLGTTAAACDALRDLE
jgi:predicted GTPase